MPDVQVHFKARYLPVLVSVLLVMQFMGAYRGWRIVLVVLGGLWLISYLWARSLTRELRLRREMLFGWVQVGDRMVERFLLNNRGRFPAPSVEVIDYSTLPGYRLSRAFSISGEDSVRWFQDFVCERRGLYTLGPMTVRAGDPFGVYAITMEYSTTVPLLVMPPVVPLPVIELAAGGRAGEGRRRTNALERTVSAAYVREYQPGDVHRWIHWPTSARRDSLYVRLFEGAPAGDWWVVLDMHQGVQVGEGQDATEEHAVILAASLADRGLRVGRSVGLVAADKDLVWLPPRGGEAQRWLILRSLALVSRGAWSLADLLARMSPIIGRGTSLAVVTPDPDLGWVEELASMVQRGAIPTVLLFDLPSFGGDGDMRTVRSALEDLGVVYYEIQRDLLQGAAARYLDDRRQRRSGGVRDVYDGQVHREAWKVVL